MHNTNALHSLDSSWSRSVAYLYQHYCVGSTSTSCRKRRILLVASYCSKHSSLGPVTGCSTYNTKVAGCTGGGWRGMTGVVHHLYILQLSYCTSNIQSPQGWAACCMHSTVPLAKFAGCTGGGWRGMTGVVLISGVVLTVYANLTAAGVTTVG